MEHEVPIAASIESARKGLVMLYEVYLKTELLGNVEPTNDCEDRVFT